LSCGPGRSRVMVVKSAGARLVMCFTSERDRVRKAANLTPRSSSSLERQQGQQPADRGDDPGAGVAGLADQGGQGQGHQVGDGQQQPGPLLGQDLPTDVRLSGVPPAASRREISEAGRPCRRSASYRPWFTCAGKVNHSASGCADLAAIWHIHQI
jgi:hypothetical protein